ncbi:MAG TPA: response regulator [Verrucomicrobiae bacterium]|nr:response regulator [Verrucomicrobiae bacterium]
MPTVLLVEDNLHIQRIYHAKLEREGFRVITADDGAVGLERATEHHPDVILLDIMLPKVDGFQVLAKLRDDPSLCGIPVFVLSNRASPNDVQRANSLGARHFFAKGTLKLQNIVLQLRSACGLKTLLVFTSNAQTAVPIRIAVDHPQLLCAIITVPLELVGAVERGAPDLVILDGRAPNAFTLLQQLRTSPHGRNVPLVAIRDHNQTQHRLDDFIDSDRIDTDLRPFVLTRLGLSGPAAVIHGNAEPAAASA